MPKERKLSQEHSVRQEPLKRVSQENSVREEQNRRVRDAEEGTPAKPSVVESLIKFPPKEQQAPSQTVGQLLESRVPPTKPGQELRLAPEMITIPEKEEKYGRNEKHPIFDSP